MCSAHFFLLSVQKAVTIHQPVTPNTAQMQLRLSVDSVLLLFFKFPNCVINLYGGVVEPVFLVRKTKTELTLKGITMIEIGGEMDRPRKQPCRQEKNFGNLGF